MTLEYTNKDEKVYGPNITTLKGNTRQSNTDTVVTDYITVPKGVMKSKKNINISRDILFVNTIPLFMNISRNIKFTTIECISSSTLKQLVSPMETIKSIYTKRGFEINTPLINTEFKPLRSEFINMNIKLNTTS